MRLNFNLWQQCQTSNDQPQVGAAAAVPASLIQLTRQMEDVDKDKVATKLAIEAKFVIEAGWNGFLTIIDLGRMVPLAEAIQRSTAELDAAAVRFITHNSETYGNRGNVRQSKVKFTTRLAFKVSVFISWYNATSYIIISIENNIVTTDYFSFLLFSDIIVIKKLKNLDFDGFGFVHYEAIYLALVLHYDAWTGGPLNDEVSAIQQFCGRLAKLIKKFNEQTGRGIAVNTR